MCCINLSLRLDQAVPEEPMHASITDGKGKIDVQVFKDQFSEETFNRLESYFGCDSSDEAANPVEGINKKFEEIKIVSNNWMAVIRVTQISMIS